MRAIPTRPTRSALAAAAALALVTLTPGVAVAGLLPDPGGPTGGGVTGAVGEVLGQAAGSVAPGAPTGPGVTAERQPAPPPSSDDDLDGYETEDPERPDHGGSSSADVDLGGEDVADIGSNRAQTNDDDSTESDATLLALGGEEVAGAHAGSEGSGEEHFGDPLAPLCEGSSGQVCLEVLYADAAASDDGSTSSSESRTGVANACVGGAGADAADGCDGPLEAGVARSSASSQRDQGSGRTTAESESELGTVCLSRDPVTAACTVSADVVRSEGSADSGGARSEADRDSYLLVVGAGGSERARVDEPTEIALQPACADPSLLCVYLNQGETYLGEGTAGHAQTALDLNALPGEPTVLGIELARSETLVHNDGGEGAASGSPGDNRPPPVVKGAQAIAPDGVKDAIAGVSGLLPNTGGVGTALLALAFAALGGGALLMARGRGRLPVQAG